MMPPAAAVPGMLTVVVAFALRDAEGLLELDAWLLLAAAEDMAGRDDGGREGGRRLEELALCVNGAKRRERMI